MTMKAPPCCRCTACAVIVLLILLGALSPSRAATTVSGSVSGTWTDTGSPYLVVGDMLIGAGKTLTIQSNVLVSFQGPYVLEVVGSLRAVGTAEGPIVFSRAYTNVPWGGIFFNQSQPSCLLSYCEIHGANNSAIRIQNCTPAVRDCVIANNSSTLDGGGISAVTGGGTLNLSRCVITNNVANGGAGGGGILINGTALVDQCLISRNQATSAYPGGGGISLNNGNSRIQNCIIRNNVGKNTYGGAISAFNGSATVINSLVVSNSATYGGAGIFIHGNTFVSVINSTLIGNAGFAVESSGGPGVLTNCIVYYNNSSADQIAGNVAVAYSDIEHGVVPGPGNISETPLLDRSTFLLRAGSPCIDAGHPNAAFNDSCVPPSLGGVRNDMGAFGGPGACSFAPIIVSQPRNMTVPIGSSATFSVVAIGATPLNYQWLFGGLPIHEATTANYTINSVQVEDLGSYSVVVGNSAGFVTTDAAVLAVEGPHTATATASVVNGFLVGVNITRGGLAYTNVPKVKIIGGGGSGAQALAEVKNGVVTAVNITNPGKDYVAPPLIVIAPPFIPRPTVAVTAHSLLSFANLAQGTHYQLQYSSGSLLRAVGGPFRATSSTFTQLVSGAASMDSYRLTTLPAPVQAQANAQLVNGFVVAITVVSGGSGYTDIPTVVIVGGGGSNATAIATVEAGSVTAVKVINPGIGYTNTPSVVVALPPTESLPLESVTQVMEVHMEALSPYDSYQLEFSEAATGGWVNSNPPFISASARDTQLINVTGKMGFFRIRYEP